MDLIKSLLKFSRESKQKMYNRQLAKSSFDERGSPGQILINDEERCFLYRYVVRTFYWLLFDDRTSQKKAQLRESVHSSPYLDAYAVLPRDEAGASRAPPSCFICRISHVMRLKWYFYSSTRKKDVYLDAKNKRIARTCARNAKRSQNPLDLSETYQEAPRVSRFNNNKRSVQNLSDRTSGYNKAE